MSDVALRDRKKTCGTCAGSGTVQVAGATAACGTCQGSGTVPWSTWAYERLFDILWNADASRQACDETAREIINLVGDEPAASAPDEAVRQLCGLLVECRARLPRVKTYIIDHRADNLRAARDPLDDRIEEALRRYGAEGSVHPAPPSAQA